MEKSTEGIREEIPKKNLGRNGWRFWRNLMREYLEEFSEGIP